MNRTLIIVLVIVGILACLCVGMVIAIAATGAIAGFGLTQPVVTVSEQFLGALKEDNFTQAFDTFSPGLKKTVGSVDSLKTQIENGQAKPKSWKINSRNMENNTGKVEGSLEFANGKQGTLTIELVKNGEEWKIEAFSLQPAP